MRLYGEKTAYGAKGSGEHDTDVWFSGSWKVEVISVSERSGGHRAAIPGRSCGDVHWTHGGPIVWVALFGEEDEEAQEVL